MAAKRPDNYRIGTLEDLDDATLLELLQTHTPKEAGKLLGCSIHAIYRRRRKPAFRKMLVDLADDIRVKVSLRAASDVELALDTLVSICKDSYEDHAKVNAAREILTVHKTPPLDTGSSAGAGDEDRTALLDEVMRATASAVAKRESKVDDAAPASKEVN